LRAHAGVERRNTEVARGGEGGALAILPGLFWLDVEAGWNSTSVFSSDLIFQLNRPFMPGLDERPLAWSPT
jgi:hypothetical protein